jgi:hypothetical protein
LTPLESLPMFRRVNSDRELPMADERLGQLEKLLREQGYSGQQIWEVTKVLTPAPEDLDTRLTRCWGGLEVTCAHSNYHELAAVLRGIADLLDAGEPGGEDKDVGTSWLAKPV